MIQVPLQTVMARLADWLMLPLMYLLQGTFNEVPQRTHRWNNHKLNEKERASLDSAQFIRLEGVLGARHRWYGILPIFHMPIFGGWKKFVVLQAPPSDNPWMVGWVPGDDRAGVSMIRTHGLVRVTIGDGPVAFFGIDHNGQQLKLTVIGEGYICNAGRFAYVPLF